ncbi:MFS transporter [Paenibacillus puerhi]|uniref:MFS transporter n=1 Tax=Paenibacillus puerhi TaxID=2692622 RepID=UPI001359EAF7|nr:MFS transporter [Paenibacillus puerhi]
MNAKGKLWTLDFVLLSMSNLFLFLAFEMLMPALPVYLAGIGGNASEIGLVMGCFTITAIWIRPFSGHKANRYGKKLLLVIGGILCLAATGSYYAAATVFGVFVIRLLHGFGFGLATTLYGTIASDMIPPSRLGEGMGYFGLSNTLATSIGPFLGVVLMEQAGFQTLIVYSIVMLAVACLCNLILRVKVTHPQEDRPIDIGEASPAALSPASKGDAPRWIERRALFPSLLGMMAGFGFGGILSFIALYGKELAVSNIGYFFLAVSVFEVLVRFGSGRLYDAKGPLWVILPSTLLTFLGTVILSYASSMATLLAAALFFGLGFGAMFPALQAWVIDRVERDRRGSATATFYNLFDAGIAGGSVLLGFISGLTSYGVMYRVSSLFYIAILIVCLIYEYRRQHRGKRLKAAHSIPKE